MPTTHPPSLLLQPFVKAYLVIESEQAMTNRVLPDTSLVMAFRFRGQVSYVHDKAKSSLEPMVVSGLRKSGRLINYSPGAGNVLVLFREAGAHAFMKEPLHELCDTSVALGDLNGYSNLSLLEDQLAAATNNQQRIAAVEQFLLSRLHNHKADTLVLAALQKLHATNGMVRIKALASDLCISQDAFEKRFRRTVGMSPKQFAYIIRMRAILNSDFKKYSLADIAFHAGYFDQSHFNKDFKVFTGQTPTEFMKAPVFW
jgi:AraC-like DNA-binding protein